MNTAWYLHPTSCDLGSRTRPSSKFLRVRGGSRGGTLNGGRLPETSNCFCHPGKAGGLPLCAKTPSPGKWNGNREAHRADCVRIVHKHRNLLAHAPDRLHEEVSADYTDMIYAASAAEVAERRKAFLRKWRLKCRAVADSLEEAGDKLFTFTRLPP